MICIGGSILINRLFSFPLPRQSVTLLVDDDTRAYDTDALTVAEAECLRGTLGKRR